MIKLGKLTDYAIVVLVQLAREGQAGEARVSRSAQFLSEKTGIPAPTVSKVLKTLAHKGLIESVRGASGGYRLTRPADELSAGEVIEAIDGPIAIVSCVDGANESCGTASQCPARNKWTPVNRVIRDALFAFKLSDLGVSCGVSAPSERRLYQVQGGAHDSRK